MLMTIILIALTFSGKAFAQDVYNFYFQKNSAPAIQQASLPAPAANTSTAPLPVMAPPVAEDFKKWELAPTQSWMNYRLQNDQGHTYAPNGVQEDNARGFGLTGAYRFNKFIATDGSAHSLKRTNGQSVAEFSGGVFITPIHINFFGHELIEWGLGAGVMTGRRKVATDLLPGSYSVRESRVIDPYLSTRIAINLNSQVAVTGDIRGGKNGTQSSLGLRFRF
jgi:hypothetical protein